MWWGRFSLRELGCVVFEFFAGQCRRTLGRLAAPGRLLDAIGDLQESQIREAIAGDLQTDRQVFAGVAAGNDDARQPSAGRECVAASAAASARATTTTTTLFAGTRRL